MTIDEIELYDVGLLMKYYHTYPMKMLMLYKEQYHLYAG